MNKQDVISRIKDYISSNGGSYSEWYIGIASSPRERLFNDHNVNEKIDAWIYQQAESENEAREIEKFFLDNLRTDGGSGGGINPDYVYAYLKNNHTDP